MRTKFSYFFFFWIICICYSNTNVLLPFCTIYMYIKINMSIKKINYFVFVVHQVNKHVVSRRWFTKADVRYFKSGALKTIPNITRSMVSWKKESLFRFISKILFIDTEQLSKMQIFSQVFFKDFVDRFGTTYLKNGFLWSWFSKNL